VPGLFTPVEWGEYLLVDGGLLNNVPVQVLRDAGADYVIAVDLGTGSLRSRRPHNVFEIWMLTINALVRLTHSESELADCAICPDVADLSMVDFEDIAELICRGRQAAEAKIERLRADLGNA